MANVPANVTIGASIVATHLEDNPPADLEAACRASFAYAVSDQAKWLARDELEVFKLGVGGVLLYYLKRDPVIVERINREMRTLAVLSAAMDGVPVNWEAVDVDEERHPPLGLLRYYREAKGA